MVITDETPDEIETTFVIDFLYTLMQREITNTISRRGNTLFIKLSNQTTARVLAPKVADNMTPPQQTEAIIHNIGTLRYILEHDYGYGDEHEHLELNRLDLRNIEECRIYIEDAITSQLNAYFTNNLIEFMNGEKFLLSIELKQ